MVPRFTARELLHSELLINGEWVSGSQGQRFPVTNPSTGEVITQVASASQADVHTAIAAAQAALPAWSGLTAVERSRILRKWFDLIVANVDSLAEILTLEQGKPLEEARGEILYGANFIEWFAEEVKRLYGETIPTNVSSRRLLTIRQPIGVTAAITPWNFPMAMIARKAGPAIAAGCPMIIKPAAETPLSALAIGHLALEAGVHPGVLQVITGPASVIGPELTASPAIRALSFTGSTEVGKKLMSDCAHTVKKVAMELGGNAPVIVFDDADIEVAVSGTIDSKFRNSGQTCVCANRIFVQAGIHDRFVEALSTAVAKLNVGDGFSSNIQQGPLINLEAVEKVESHISDAVSRGAKVVVGGNRHSIGGTFFEPTLITSATMDMTIASEETFGPVAPIFIFETEEEGLEMANSTPFGLAGYFFTQDLARMWRVSEKLEVGVVGVNTGLISYEGAPFGGVKESGVGREGSLHGIEEFLEMKYICIGAVN